MERKIINGKGIIPDNATEIEARTFFICTSLQSIVIPDSVMMIWSSVFKRCTSLQSIKIPNSVASIGDDAFAYCISLQSITIATQEKRPDMSREKIEYLLQELSEYSKEISLRVPIGCGYAYRHHTAFEGKFKNIIADIDA